jgi:hypothetical protein
MSRASSHVRRALGLLGLVVAGRSLASDARALSDSGNLLTVGNWTLVTSSEGLDLRAADDRFLGWELRDGNGMLLAQGAVPGSDTLGVDATPALSRDPVSGDLVLVWSRQAQPGMAREIALERFGADGWVASSLQSVVSGAGDQLEPSIVHDATGTAWLAWIDGSLSRTVKFAGVSSTGRVLGTQTLSDDISVHNGAPSVGIDASGSIFVAYAGTPTNGGDVNLFVLTPNPVGGGLSHLPDPFIELGLRGTVPAPSIGVVVDPTAPVTVPSRVSLTVLGGTPVAWWTENDGQGQLARFRYAAMGERNWSDSELRTIDLHDGVVGTIPDALALIEARLRRVIDQNPGGGPVLGPINGGLLNRITPRR